MSYQHSIKYWEPGPGALVGYASSVPVSQNLLSLLQKIMSGIEKRKWKLWHGEQIDSHRADWYTIMINSSWWLLQDFYSDDFHLVATWPNSRSLIVISLLRYNNPCNFGKLWVNVWKLHTHVLIGCRHTDARKNDNTEWEVVLFFSQVFFPFNI